MTLLDQWKQRRFETASSSTGTAPTSQVAHPDHLLLTHLSRANHLKDMIASCGGISSADNAIAHQQYILTLAYRSDSPPAHHSRPDIPAEVKTLEDNYHYAELIYLTRRLQQIHDCVGPHHFPKLVKQDDQARIRSQNPNGNLAALFSTPSYPTATTFAVQLKEECARYLTNLRHSIDTFYPEYAGQAMTTQDVHISPNILRFIFDNKDGNVPVSARLDEKRLEA